MTDYTAVPLPLPHEDDPSRRPPDVHGRTARGFGLYVGVDGVDGDPPVDVVGLAQQVGRALRGVPGVRAAASLVLAPEGAHGDSALEHVRRALREPRMPDIDGDHGEADVVIDLARHRVAVGGEPVHLRYRELVLLEHLSLNLGRVRAREQLQAALQLAGGAAVSTRTIDVYLQRLRRRLGAHGDMIRTVRGRGYRLDPHPDLRVIADARGGRTAEGPGTDPAR